MAMIVVALRIHLAHILLVGPERKHWGNVGAYHLSNCLIEQLSDTLLIGTGVCHMIPHLNL
jgi:hypothetical protein